MDDFSQRIAALSPAKLELLKARLKEEGIYLEKNPALEPVEEKEYYPLSSVQKRLFLIDRFEETGLVYNVTVSRTTAGNPGKKQIEEIFKTLVKRHETFRTSFQLIAGEPVQCIRKEIDFEIEYFDLQTNGKLQITHIIGNFIRPFDLAEAPLLRVGLVKLSTDRHLLVIDMHHIISDQASKRILTGEFNRLYRGEDLSPLKIQYKDFCHWLDSGPVENLLKQQESYWLREYSGEIPLLNLPADYPRPREKNYQGSSLSFKIEKQFTAPLKALALKKNTTLFVVLFSIYNIFLAKISNQKDIIVGTPVAGRKHSGLGSIIGMFVNTLPLRNLIEDHLHFDDFLIRVKKRTLEAFENQDYLFEDLVNHVVKNRDTGRNSIFDVFFTFTYPELDHVRPPVSPRHEEDTGTAADPEPGEAGNQAGYSMFDMFFFGAEIREELILAITYSTGLFKKETIQRFIKYFREIVSAVAADNRIKLKDIEISHDLGIAKADVLQDEDDEFGF